MRHIKYDFRFSIKLTDIAIIFATLIGPVLAVQAQKWLERKREVKDRRLAIFRTLVTTRAETVSQRHIEAFNAVPVEFYGSSGKLREINDAWKLYLDHHVTDGPFNETWLQKRLDLFQDMLYLMSRFLGFSFSKAQISRDIYSPRVHGEIETEQTIIRKGLAKLFRGEIGLPMAVKEFPADPGSSELQAALKELLAEALQRANPRP